MSFELDSPESTYRDPRWLRQHLTNSLNFYYPDCIDHISGGYVPQLSDKDGHVYDGKTKHVVATARLVHNFAIGMEIGGPDWCRSAAEHGITFLTDHHRDSETGGYPWVLNGTEAVDETYSAYGHAFVLLAYAEATNAGIPGAEEHVASTFDLIDEHFWEPEYGLCKSRLNSDWSEIEAYRGQNANMHLCEAMLAAYEATGEQRYLDRAYSIAENLAFELTNEGDGLLWEHYTQNWEIDRDYNRDQPSHPLRPWGYQPGHLAEWSKLLLQLYQYQSDEWLVQRAKRFFEAAVGNGWDNEYGGFYYNFDLEGHPITEDKYYWPLAEGLTAAAMLADETDDAWYWDWYDRIWAYTADNMVNLKYGNWYTKLTRDGDIHDEIDSTPKLNVGYHQINALYDAMSVLGGR